MGTVVTRVAGILLAAGNGTRLGRPKATVELAGLSLADRGVRLLRDGGADPVLVVTGAVPVEIPGTLSVHNPDWLSGMGSSLATGLRALAGPGLASPGPDSRGGADVAAAVIALADQPLIGPEAVRRLIAAHVAGATVAVAAYNGKPRNPVLIGRLHWAAVLETADGDTGARPFLRAHPGLVTLVECGDVGSPVDIDTPEDLARVRARLHAGQASARAEPGDLPSANGQVPKRTGPPGVPSARKPRPGDQSGAAGPLRVVRRPVRGFRNAERARRFR